MPRPPRHGVKLSATSPGNPARLPPSQDTCPLCSHAAFKVAASGRRPKTVQILKKLWIARKDLAQEALDIRIWKGNRAAETYVGKMPKSADSNTPQSDWPQLLLRLGAHALRKKARRVYYQAVRKDRRLIRQKVFFPRAQNLYKHASVEREASEIRDVAELCGPSLMWLTMRMACPHRLTILLHKWWGRASMDHCPFCTQCYSVQARRLEPSDLPRTAPALMSPKVCAAGKHQEYVPQPEDIRVALQRLRPRVLAALRLLDVAQGFTRGHPTATASTRQ